jgi:hypothetical protein
MSVHADLPLRGRTRRISAPRGRALAPGRSLSEVIAGKGQPRRSFEPVARYVVGGSPVSAGWSPHATAGAVSAVVLRWITLLSCGETDVARSPSCGAQRRAGT